MHDFSQKYRGVTHFGLWAEEGADDCGKQDAFAIIASAVKRTPMEDVRCEQLDDALAFLEQFSVRDRPFKDFRNAMGVADPVQRFYAMKDAALRIAKGLNP